MHEVESNRDYLAEMDEALETILPSTDFANPIVARELVGKLRANDPELLAGWLDQRAEVIVTDWVHQKTKNRGKSPEAQKRATFSQYAAEFSATGDEGVLRDASKSLFDLRTLVVTSDNLKRRLGDMNGSDHLFVADSHAQTEKTSRLLKSFHRAVAKKVGDQLTRNVFTEDEYRAMFRSITRRDLE